MLMSTEDTRFEIIEDKLNTLQRSLDIHLKDTDAEIGDLGQLRISVATLQESVNNLTKNMERHVDRVSDRVAQAVEPMLEEAQQLGNKIDKKKFKILREPLKIKWKFWK